ncbi:Diacylglycerol kinase delta [Collichthys lucidus]|uniref:Diacylglycerol kinase n=1 Tax=Collichthys lucidus TaxID=240159 RepID=A0A4V6AT97_COLLU|nr:Diacylglycerol kinase delta [Collichthys lucidus]
MAEAGGPESAAARCPDESSDSEPEQEPGSPQKLIRKVSTSGQIRSKTVLKEGNLLKQTNSFQRWKRRYFKLRGRTLYYAQTAKSIIFDEVDLTDASVAESSTKNVNNSFTVITPCRRLILCADNRKEMEEWMAALRSVQNRHNYESTQYSMDHFSGMHNWYACSHARPTYCNVCREALSGVTSHGLSCEVCKFKAHKRCAVRATNNCKWTTLASIGKDIIEDEDGVSMPHQWLEGNLPVSAKCNVCDKTCGSVLRLQDWRCLWCKAMVHSGCKDQLSSKCPLGQCKVSVIPPTALNSIDSDGFWKASCPPSCTSPLLVFVNSKSGDNQGVKFLRRFKQLLNPAQVFDLMNGGPHLGLRLFQKFDTFRILVCGGDGSVGWVLSEIDALTLHKQCQLGVLPLGTGNDLARVLGWGSACDDDTQLPQILEKLERASTKMLDRWSIMVYETKFPRQHSASTVTEDCSDDSEVQQILTYEDSVAAHLSKILTSDQHSVVISSAKVLCETVKDFVARVGKAYEKNTESSEESEAMAKKCGVLKEKLDSLLKTLNEESQASTVPLPAPPPTIAEEQEEVEGDVLPPPLHHHLHHHHPPLHTSCSPRPKTTSSSSSSSAAATIFKPREQLMLRANSLKKAIRQIIEHTEKAVDEQNAQTQQNLFSLSRTEEDEGLVEEDEEDEVDEDKMSLQSTYSTKHRNTRRVSKTPCEKLISKGSLSLGSSASLPVHTGSRENMPMLNTKILYPGFRAISGSLSSSSVISRLLVNADPFSCDPDNMDCYTEKCVMNNYFGIGLDAKISLDFNNKRDEHPEKCRSRTKNMMWYGVLGTKELLHRTYKNLEQRVLLECRTVKITILGDEGVPVQVDGEAWVQPPGYIKIIHKNRTQTLTRDRAFESTLKSWEDKQKCEFPRSPAQAALTSQPEIISEDEASLVREFGQAAGALIHSLEQELAHAVNASSKAMDVVYANSKSSGMVSNVKVLFSETELLLAGKMSMLVLMVLLLSLQQLDPPQQEQLNVALSSVAQQLRRLADVSWLCPIIDPSDHEVLVQKYWFKIHQWGTDEVGAWLDFLSLTEYKDIFIRHDVRGAELIHLERRDLKRILQGIRELNRNSSASEA